MNSLSMAEHVAVVTGAAEGIGQATSRLLAQRGAHVILSGRVDDERVTETVAELLAAGHAASSIAADVTDPSAVKALYQSVFKTHRRLDVLVSNAGALGDARLGMISEELLTSTMEINLLGSIRHIQSAARLMQRSGSGSIVAVGSIMGLAGNAGQVPYSAAKAGLVGAVRSAAKELGPDGIRVNLVAPGFIDTKLTRDLDEEIRTARLDSIALQRAGTPTDVAELIAFLASPSSSYLTGQVIGIDGGMVV